MDDNDRLLALELLATEKIPASWGLEPGTTRSAGQTLKLLSYRADPG